MGNGMINGDCEWDFDGINPLVNIQKLLKLLNMAIDG